MHVAKMHRDRDLHAKDGMPTCAACSTSFKQWKGLRDHLLSGACPEPDALRKITSGRTLSNSGSDMQQLQELRRQVQGSPKAQLAQLAALPPAQILQQRCVVCGFWTPDHTIVRSNPNVRLTLVNGRLMEMVQDFCVPATRHRLSRVAVLPFCTRRVRGTFSGLLLRVTRAQSFQ